MLLSPPTRNKLNLTKNPSIKKNLQLFRSSPTKNKFSIPTIQIKIWTPLPPTKTNQP